jgi:hypothetical protein
MSGLAKYILKDLAKIYFQDLAKYISTEGGIWRDIFSVFGKIQFQDCENYFLGFDKKAILYRRN